MSEKIRHKDVTRFCFVSIFRSFQSYCRSSRLDRPSDNQVYGLQLATRAKQNKGGGLSRILLRNYPIVLCRRSPRQADFAAVHASELTGSTKRRSSQFQAHSYYLQYPTRLHQNKHLSQTCHLERLDRAAKTYVWRFPPYLSAANRFRRLLPG
jgi:hypothetical protein